VVGITSITNLYTPPEQADAIAPVATFAVHFLASLCVTFGLRTVHTHSIGDIAPVWQDALKAFAFGEVNFEVCTRAMRRVSSLLIPLWFNRTQRRQCGMTAAASSACICC
jgi:hypothetical protein